jgi:hypothetical protein
LRIDGVIGLIAAGEQIDAERTLRERAHAADGCRDLFRRDIGAAPGAEPAGIRHGGSKLGRAAGAGHGREQDRMFDAEALQQRVHDHCLLFM